jgi:beta-galactosidase
MMQTLCSHFGIMDLTGFWKDRTHWYASWFPTYNKGPDYVLKAEEIHLHAFPHWNWQPGDKVDIWAYSNAASVELLVNGKSQGKQTMEKFGHVEWKSVAFEKGNYQAVAYDSSGKAVATKQVNTTSAAVSLRATIRDGVGETLYAGCNDFGLVQVEVLDADGQLCPDPDNTDDINVTFAVSGTPTAWVEGSGNGDPSCLVNNKSPTRPAYHGLALGVIGAGNATGTITVPATAPGLKSSTVTMKVVKADPAAPGFSEKWCWQGDQW